MCRARCWRQQRVPSRSSAPSPGSTSMFAASTSMLMTSPARLALACRSTIAWTCSVYSQGLLQWLAQTSPTLPLHDQLGGISCGISKEVCTRGVNLNTFNSFGGCALPANVKFEQTGKANNELREPKVTVHMFTLVCSGDTKRRLSAHNVNGLMF